MTVNISTASQASELEPAARASAPAFRTLLWSFAASALAHAALLHAISNREVVLAQMPPGLMVVRLASGSRGSPGTGAQPTNDADASAHVAHAKTARPPQKPDPPRAAETFAQASKPAPKAPARHGNPERAAQPRSSRAVETRDTLATAAERSAAPSSVEGKEGAPPNDDDSRIASSGPATGGSGTVGSGAGRGGGGGLGDGGVARGSYYRLLSEWLERYKQYPDLARRRGLEGTASLRVAIRRDGSVISAALQAPSRHDVLDRAALDLVRRAEPFPRMPSDLTGERFEFVVPIHFHLDRRG